MAAHTSSRQFFLRVGALIAICTVLLTASFIGVLAFLSGDITGFETRVPWYLIAAALAFVGSILLLENQGARGRPIIVTAVVTATTAFVLLALGIEGMVFAAEHPGRVFDSQLVLYLFAAGVMGTGFGYWGLKHWREFTGGTADGSL